MTSSDAEQMDIFSGAVNFVSDIVGNFPDVKNVFDLEKENVRGIFTFNLTLLAIVLKSLTRNRMPLKTETNFKKVYDYVIVGGGTAGSILANRLSQKPCVSVLLLEAGGVPPILTDVPSYTELFHRTHIDWAYRTTPQQYAAFGQVDNRVILNNGKVLGGSSVLNAMLYVRGNWRNYDSWEAEGATGWSYKDVLPYFLKLEDNRNIAELDPGYHRIGGPMTMEKIVYDPEIKGPLLEATENMGYEQVDPNGRRQTGIYDLQGTIRNQQRCSTAKAYLEPANRRPNLDIVTDAYARKILIDKVEEGYKSYNRAYGVEFDHSGKTHIVKARREVIISAGAIRTPQLLMLSGIGPSDHLRKFNINVVADLPVGKNLQDHTASFLVYTINETITPVVQKSLKPENILEYVHNRTGPLTCPNQISVMAFLDGLNTRPNSRDFPRQELYFAEYDVIDIELNMNVRPELFAAVFAPYLLKPLYICFASLVQPQSRGEITLNSTDPYDTPNINPNYYKDDRDLEAVVEGMKICNEIAKQPAMQQVQAQPLATVFPACKEFVGDDDKYFACVARQVVFTFWHYTGTARMGDRNDRRSVVDPQLKVIGVENLRVVNAAVMPDVTSGNTNVPTMMIAEKFYDMIKDDVMCSGGRQIPQMKHSYMDPFVHNEPDPRSWIPDRSSWIPDRNSRIPDRSSWIPDPTSWLPDQSSWIPDPRSWLPDRRSWIPDWW